jgi:hypothetical protein
MPFSAFVSLVAESALGTTVQDAAAAESDASTSASIVEHPPTPPIATRRMFHFLNLRLS